MKIRTCYGTDDTIQAGSTAGSDSAAVQTTGPLNETTKPSAVEAPAADIEQSAETEDPQGADAHGLLDELQAKIEELYDDVTDEVGEALTAAHEAFDDAEADVGTFLDGIAGKVESAYDEVHDEVAGLLGKLSDLV